MSESKNKMSFERYYAIQKKLIGDKISYSPDSPAFFDSIRAWNTLATIFPEKVENIVAWSEPDSAFVTIPIEDAQRKYFSIGEKKLVKQRGDKDDVQLASDSEIPIVTESGEQIPVKVAHSVLTTPNSKSSKSK